MTKEIDSELLSKIFETDEEVLLQIKAVVDDLCKGMSGGTSHLTQEELPFYSAIVEVLRDNHKKMIPTNEGKSLVPRLKGFDYGSFRNAFHKVEEIIESEVSNCNKRERFRFYRLVVKCTYEYMRSQVKQKKTIEELNEVKDCVTENIKDYDSKEQAVKTIQKAQAQLDGRKPSVGIIALLEGLQDAESVIEASFPGYLRAGFLHAIVKAEDIEWP